MLGVAGSTVLVASLALTAELIGELLNINPTLVAMLGVAGSTVL